MALHHNLNKFSQWVVDDVGVQRDLVRTYSSSASGSTLCCMVPREWYSKVHSTKIGYRIPEPQLCPISRQRLRTILPESQTDASLDSTTAELLSSWSKVCVKVVPKRMSGRDAAHLCVPPTAAHGHNKAETSVDSTSFSNYLSYCAAESETKYWRELPGNIAMLGATHERVGRNKDHVGELNTRHIQVPPQEQEGLGAVVDITREHMTSYLASCDQHQTPILNIAQPTSTASALPAAAGSGGDGGFAMAREPSRRSRSNVYPVDFVLESERALFLFGPHVEYTLEHALMYSTRFLSSAYSKPLFIVYQVVQALHAMHRQGLAHGDLKPAHVLLDHTLWVTLGGIGSPAPAGRRACRPSVERPLAISAAERDMHALGETYATALTAWVNGAMSNFDYLMLLNGLVGRSLHDPSHHPVLPWVVDFTSASGGWRDLTRSKFRLHKGDQQLDFTYGTGQVSAEGIVPHHVSDVLSEVTYYVYHSRRTPKELLCQHVRSTWVPGEYPSSMQRLYAWTPDECIPAFFTDATLFDSQHPDLDDLALPPWAATGPAFVAWHRRMLESDHVSAHLHHWIDLNFGYKLSGRAAVAAKNVMLSIIQSSKTLKCTGVTQLFSAPHPMRACAAVDDDRFDPVAPMPPSANAVAMETPRPQNHTESGGKTPSAETKTSVFFGPDSQLSKLFQKKSDALHKTATTASALSTLGSAHGIGLDPDVSPAPTPGGAVGGGAREARGAPHLHRRGSEKHAATVVALAAGDLVPGPSSLASLRDSDLLPGSTTVSPTASGGLSGLAVRMPSSSVKAQGELSQAGIPLPYDFQATRALQQVEHINAFLLVVLGRQSTPDTGHTVPRNRSPSPEIPPGPCDEWVSPSAPATEWQARVDADMLALGCLISEVFLNDSMRTWAVRRVAGVGGRDPTDVLVSCFRESVSALPPCVATGVRLLLASDPASRPSATELLFARSPRGLLVFPDYFAKLYDFASQMRRQSLERRPDVARRALKFLLTLPDEGMALVLPMLVDLLHKKESRRQALDLLDALGARLGPTHCNKLLRPALVDAHEATNEVDLLVKLFSKRVLGSIIDRLGTETYAEIFLQYLLDGLVHASDRVCDAAAGGIEVVVSKFGPLLSARLIVRPVLRQLSRSKGHYAAHVLGHLSAEVGTFLLWKMYIPYLQAQVDAHVVKMDSKSESFMCNSAHLLRCCLGQVSVAELEQAMSELSITILHPIVEALVSVHSTFSPTGRSALTRQYAELLMCISRALDRELSFEHLRTLLQLFFSAFDWIHATPLMNPTTIPQVQSRRGSVGQREPAGGDGSSILGTSHGSVRSTTSTGSGLAEDLSVLAEAFDAKMASYVYSTFCQLMGQETMRRSLYNSSLVEQLMYEDSAAASSDTAKKLLPRFVSHRVLPSARIDADLYDGAGDVGPQLQESATLGAWQNHVEYQIDAKTKFPRFHFQHTLLDTMQGHTGGVKSVVVFNGERTVASASKDKTVKLWSVQQRSSVEDPCRRTYLGHRRSVFDVLHTPRSGHIASCDGSVHVWDPENGHCLRQYEFRRNPGVCMAYVTDKHTLALGTNEGTLKLLDLRGDKAVTEWRPSNTAHGTLRVVAVDPSCAWVAVGFSSGLVSLLDVRTGLLLYCWRAHDNDITAIRPLSSHSFLTASVDHTAALWSWTAADSVSASTRFKGSGDPIIGLDTEKDTLYALSSTNRVLQYDDFRGTRSQLMSPMTKLKGMKGTLSCMNVLPLNQVVLFGSESGHLGFFR
eukprot:m.1342664 g.1342664  ORF g.1342664 m.1342664 type:complete len:1750 (+) comp24899_c0_seq7:136-5385(+)